MIPWDKKFEHIGEGIAMIAITVLGVPAPQGSKNVNRHGATYEVSKRVKPWREAVKFASLEMIRLTPEWEMMDGPLTLFVTFYFNRPQSHYRTGRNAHLLRDAAPERPMGTPDLSKLIRSTEDALTDAGVWKDDSRVVDVHAGKRYVPDGKGHHQGAVIRIQDSVID